LNYTLPQENFRKNAAGLLALCEVGEKAVAVIRNLESREKIVVSTFRGIEGLIPPDVEDLLT
jgi:hypothetical protein